MLTATRTIQGGDCGEFVTNAFNGGRLHPPGYPLYALLSSLWVKLPHVNPVLMVAVLSALFGVGTAGVLYTALKRWGLSTEAALLSAFGLGISPVFWRYSGVPEVFTLNTFLAASMLWVAGRGDGPRGWSRALLIGLTFGLGLSNHHTIVAMAPVGLLAWLRAVRETPKRGFLLASATALVGLCVGLLPYLTLLGPAMDDGWFWGGDMGGSGLLHHLLRSDYGTLSLGIVGTGAEPWDNPLQYLGTLPQRFSMFLPFGALGIITALLAARRVRKATGSSVDATALLAAFILSAIVLFAMFNLAPAGLALAVVERFYLLPDVLFACFCAVGIDAVLRGRPSARVYGRYLGAGVLCLLVVANISTATWAKDTHVEDYLVNTLESVPRRSVIIGMGDLQLFGFRYMTEVQSLRADVVYVDLALMRYDWYFDHVRAQLPDLEAEFSAAATPVTAIVYSLSRDRQVFVASMAEANRFFQGPNFYSYPFGTLLAVVPAGEYFPRPEQVAQVNHDVFSRMYWHSAPPTDPNSWAAEAHRQYGRAWAALAGVMEQAGHNDLAESFRTRYRRFVVEGEP